MIPQYRPRAGGSIHQPTHTQAFGPGASGLPYYCAPSVCVPDVIGVRAVCVCCFVLLNRYWGIVMYGPGASLWASQGRRTHVTVDSKPQVLKKKKSDRGLTVDRVWVCLDCASDKYHDGNGFLGPTPSRTNHSFWTQDKSPSKFNLNRLWVEFWICQVTREKLNEFTTLGWSGLSNLWCNEFTTFGWSGSSNFWVSESFQVSDIQVSANWLDRRTRKVSVAAN